MLNIASVFQEYLYIFQSFNSLLKMDTEKQRQRIRRRDGARLTESGNARSIDDIVHLCQKQAATRGAYRVANQQTTAARRALEWIS